MTIVSAPGDSEHGVYALLQRARQLLETGDRAEALHELEAYLDYEEGQLSDRQDSAALAVLPKLIKIIRSEGTTLGDAKRAVDRELINLERGTQMRVRSYRSQYGRRRPSGSRTQSETYSSPRTFESNAGTWLRNVFRKLIDDIYFLAYGIEKLDSINSAPHFPYRKQAELEVSQLISTLAASFDSSLGETGASDD